MGRKWIHVLIFIVLLFTACSSPDQTTSQSEEDISISDTAVEESSSLAEEATEEAVPPTEVPPTDTPTQEIIHLEYPGKFTKVPLQKIFDCKTGTYFTSGEPYTLSEVCDQWDRNYFERPLNEELTELYPQLDILEAEFGQDENWYYTQILVYAELIDNLVLDGIYALEIDLDLDARGDILIVATAPGFHSSGEWTAEGVQVWFDTNDDVGGATAVLVDPLYDGDGYETLLVDSGIGDDPDLAFVKTYDESPGLIEFGFKVALLEGAESFEWWVWAMGTDLTAAKYDPVDFFPKDSFFAIDNTCGWIYGSYPRDLPNICQTLSPPPNIVDDVCKPPAEGCDPKLCEFWDQASCSCKIDYSCFN